MATKLTAIVREVAKRVNGIAGATAATMATNYAVDPPTTTEIDDPVFNLAYIKDVVIDVHGRLALEIASVQDPVTGIGNHPWRPYFADVTASVAHGGNLPTTGTGGKAIIGAFGRCYNAGDTDYVLTPASLERVSQYRANNGVGGIYTAGVSMYAINGTKVYATVANVVFDVCVYERADLVTAMAANGNMTLPDALADALVAGSVASIIVEDEYANTAAYYKTFYDQAITAIRSTTLTMPGMAVGVPAR